MKRGFVLLAMLLIFQSANALSEKTVADVQVSMFQSRSTGNVQQAHAKISAFGKQYNLRLQPAETSVFSPQFSMVYAKETNAEGITKFESFKPSTEELMKAEKHIFVDADSDAAVKVQYVQGKYQMKGMIDGMAITHENGVHMMTRSTDENRRGLNDYIDLRRNRSTSIPQNGKFRTTRSITQATPELFITFDYANSQTFGGSDSAIMEYLAILINAINSRYRTISDPKIFFKVTGLNAVKSRSAQPYMENHKVTSDGYDINQVLESYAKWLYNNLNSVPKHDVSTLLSGEEMVSSDGNGGYATGVAGLAYLSGACWVSSYYKMALTTSVTEDKGGFFEGTWSIAHELAHSMGAPHDGEDNSCAWDDGYIMSYKGYGTKNKFYFSSCSAQAMKNHIDSSKGTCVKSDQATSSWPENRTSAGTVMNMEEYCKKLAKRSDAKVYKDQSPDESCRNMKCTYPAPNGGYYIVTYNKPAHDGSPCGTQGGKCVDGDCVV